jgi:ABC-2 type transport system permease protein
MRHFRQLLNYELKSLFWSPATYAAGCLFLLLMGIVYISIIQEYSNSPQESLPTIDFFGGFWIPVFFLVPLITMKSIAEERKLGTLEVVMATGVNPFEFVLAKFMACYLFYLGLWSLTLLFPLIAYSILPSASMDARLLDTPSLMGGFLFVAASGLLYISIGVFASSLTRSQLVAGMLAFGFLFLLIVGGRFLLDFPIIELPFLHSTSLSFAYLQTFQHLNDFTRGVLDSRPLCLYFSGSIFFWALTTLVVEAKT